MTARTDDIGDPSRPRRGRRTWLLLPLLAILVLAVGGTALWFVAVSRAGREFDGWLQREANRGRIWTCPQRRFYGYPLKIAFACDTPTFAADTRGGRVAGSAKALRAVVLIYQPTKFIAELDGPVQVHAPDGRDITVDWTSFDIAVKGLPFDIERIALDVEHLVATLTAAAQTQTLVSAGQASMHVRRVAALGDEDPGLEIIGSVADAVSPLIDRVSGTKDPLDAEVLANVTRSGPLERGALDQRLEGWRLGGGKVDIVHATFTKGSEAVGAKGTLSVDEARRPQGAIEASVAGLDPVMKRLGVPVAASVVTSLLGNLLGGSKEAAKPDETADATAAGLHVRLTLADGRVLVGPLALPVRLSPLY